MTRAIEVSVDPTNPGQVFACCGLFELANRLWPGTEAWFAADERFCLNPPDIFTQASLVELVDQIVRAELCALDEKDETASPIRIGAPFDLLLDWWKDEFAGGKVLKVWAGTMRCSRIAKAMQYAMRAPAFQDKGLLQQGNVVYDPAEPTKKVEPFYFDGRRGANALSLDVGFSPDSLQVTTTAYPAVEFLCLVGLQRFRPRPATLTRVFEYFTWTEPLPIVAATAAVAGYLSPSTGYRFENGFRTDQRKHKAFLPAVPLRRSES